ncbi:hypothetical protein D3C76_995780 [compost metagenome]
MNPAQVRGATQHQKHRQRLAIRFGQGFDPVITLQQRRFDLLITRILHAKIQRGRQLEHVPAKPRVIEVDQAQARAFDQQVFRDEVGVDHAEVTQMAAVLAQVLARCTPGLQQQLALLIAQLLQLPETPPERIGTDQAFLIPGVPDKLVRLLPFCRMYMNSRRKRPSFGKQEVDFGIGLHPGL